MSKLLPLVNIGSKSGRFKYILAQLGQKYLVRGDSTLDYHGKITNFTIVIFDTRLSFRKNIQKTSRWSWWTIEWFVHIRRWKNASRFWKKEDQSLRSIRSMSMIDTMAKTSIAFYHRHMVLQIIDARKQFCKKNIQILPSHSVLLILTPKNNVFFHYIIISYNLLCFLAFSLQ